MKQIITIDIESSEADMQLASDAVDAQGVCLLSVGSVLTVSTIDGLKKRNIQQIKIYMNASLSEKEILQMKAAIKNELDHKFKYLEDYPALKQLKQEFYSFRTKDLDRIND